jgi:RNA polymerase sigma-70 factor (ECF subfamily)
LPRWARDLSETDDIVQEALTGVFRRIDDFEQRGEGAFGAYARQAIYNRIRDEIRRNQRRPRGEQSMDRIESDAVSPIERVIGRERMERFDQGLERLPAEYREAIVGRFELGLTYEELAREIGRPSPDAARMLVKRGIHKLAEEIADAGQ